MVKAAMASTIGTALGTTHWIMTTLAGNGDFIAILIDWNPDPS